MFAHFPSVFLFSSLHIISVFILLLLRSFFFIIIIPIFLLLSFFVCCASMFYLNQRSFVHHERVVCSLTRTYTIFITRICSIIWKSEWCNIKERKHKMGTRFVFSTIVSISAHSHCSIVSSIRTRKRREGGQEWTNEGVRNERWSFCVKNRSHNREQRLFSHFIRTHTAISIYISIYLYIYTKIELNRKIQWNAGKKRMWP